MSNAKEDHFGDETALPKVYILKYFRNDCPFLQYLLSKNSLIPYFYRLVHKELFLLHSKLIFYVYTVQRKTHKEARKLEKGVNISGQQTHIKAK